MPRPWPCRISSQRCRDGGSKWISCTSDWWQDTYFTLKWKRLWRARWWHFAKLSCRALWFQNRWVVRRICSCWSRMNRQSSSWPMPLSIPLTSKLAKWWSIRTFRHNSWHMWTWHCVVKWLGSQTPREIYSWRMDVQVHCSLIPHPGCWKAWASVPVWSAPKPRETFVVVWFAKYDQTAQQFSGAKVLSSPWWVMLQDATQHLRSGSRILHDIFSLQYRQFDQP